MKNQINNYKISEQHPEEYFNIWIKYRKIKMIYIQ